MSVKTMSVLSVLLVGLWFTAAHAFSTKYVDNEKVRVAECDGQMACEGAMSRAESKARAKVVSRAKEGCQRYAQQLRQKYGKYKYVSATMRGPGMFNRSSRMYDFHFHVHCQLYRN